MLDAFPDNKQRLGLGKSIPAKPSSSGVVCVCVCVSVSVWFVAGASAC